MADGRLEDSADKKRRETQGDASGRQEATTPHSKQVSDQVFLTLALVACCGLPLLLLAGGSFAVLSLFYETNFLVLAGGVLLFLGVAILMTWRKRRNEDTRMKKVKGGCCE